MHIKNKLLVGNGSKSTITLEDSLTAKQKNAVKKIF